MALLFYGKTKKGKVKPNYAFYRANGGPPVKAGTVIEDMTENEYNTQQHKIELPIEDGKHKGKFKSEILAKK